MDFKPENYIFFIIYVFIDVFKGIISFSGFIYFFNLFEDYQVFIIMIIYSILKNLISFILYYYNKEKNDLSFIKDNIYNIIIISFSPTLIQLLTFQYLKKQLIYSSPLIQLDSGFFYFLTVMILSNKLLNYKIIFKQNIYLIIIGLFSIINLFFIYIMEDYSIFVFLTQKITILFLCKIIMGIQEVIEKILLNENINIHLILFFQGTTSFLFNFILFIQNLFSSQKLIPIKDKSTFLFKFIITIISLYLSEYSKIILNKKYNPYIKGFVNNITSFFLFVLMSIYIQDIYFILNVLLLFIIGIFTSIFISYIKLKENKDYLNKLLNIDNTNEENNNFGKLYNDDEKNV